MPDYVLKRPSECEEGGICFQTDCPDELIYMEDETLVVGPQLPGSTLEALLNLACDLRDRAEKAEAELAEIFNREMERQEMESR